MLASRYATIFSVDLSESAGSKGPNFSLGCFLVAMTDPFIVPQTEPPA
jgi:hypothetical protein